MAPTPPDPNSYSAIARRAFLKFVQERYLDRDRDIVAFLGGSVVKGDAIRGSDADGVIILADKEKMVATRLQPLVDGIPLDVAYYTIRGLKARLAQEHQKANPYVMETIATGDVVANPRHPLAKECRREALEYWRAGAPPLAKGNQRRMRVDISELGQKLASTEDPVEQRFIASMMMPKMAEFHLRVNQQWTGTGRKLLTRLRAFDADYAEKLDRAVYRELSQQGNKQAILQLIEETLKPVGGPTRRGFPVNETFSRPSPANRPKR